MREVVGTRALVRLSLRLDRLRLSLLVLGVAAFAAMISSSFDQLYPHAADRQSFAADMAANAGVRALYGPVYGSSVAALTAWRSAAMTVVIGLVSLFLVVRHTRADEEAGRRELLGATVVGRPTRRPGGASCWAPPSSAGRRRWARRSSSCWLPTWRWPSPWRWR